MVDLVGDQLDLFCRNQAAIGMNVMGTLSSEERDERLKHHLLVSKELHPALISAESEYKVYFNGSWVEFSCCAKTQRSTKPLSSMYCQRTINFSSGTTSSEFCKPWDTEDLFMSKVGGSIISEFYSAEFTNAVPSAMSASDVVIRGEGHHRPKLKCRILDPEYCFLLPHVLGAYFEKLGSKSFAVYSIAVTDVNNNTWFVKRRYRNFERLDRHLKDIPNYTLHLPPKRIFSSSTEDAFVHQHCIQLDKYLQDLLTIANVAEQHEVWDFLSASSKNFFSTLMMFMQNYDHKKVLKQKDVIGWRKANDYEKFLAVLRRNFINVDDAVDDIVRQFKGVSDGLMHKVLGSPSSSYEPTTCTSDRHLSWNVEEINKLASTQSTSESVNSFSDNDDSDKDGNHGQEEVGPSSEANGLHSDNELNSKESPPPVGLNVTKS
ncbi:hypothetical protein P3L10_024720 [Capsicum annuum]